MDRDGPTLIADAQAGNKFAIRAVQNAPVPEWLYMLDAFHELSTMRQLGAMGPGQIPFDKIIWFAERDGLSRSETDLLAKVIRQLDNHSLSKQAAKIKSKP